MTLRPSVAWIAAATIIAAGCTTEPVTDTTTTTDTTPAATADSATTTEPADTPDTTTTPTTAPTTTTAPITTTTVAALPTTFELVAVDLTTNLSGVLGDAVAWNDTIYTVGASRHSSTSDTLGTGAVIAVTADSVDVTELPYDTAVSTLKPWVTARTVIVHNDTLIVSGQQQGLAVTWTTSNGIDWTGPHPVTRFDAGISVLDPVSIGNELIGLLAEIPRAGGTEAAIFTIVRSDDDARTWTQTPIRCNQPDCIRQGDYLSQLLDIDGTLTIYSDPESDTAPFGLLTSTDNGQTWTRTEPAGADRYRIGRLLDASPTLLVAPAIPLDDSTISGPAYWSFDGDTVTFDDSPAGIDCQPCESNIVAYTAQTFLTATESQPEGSAPPVVWTSPDADTWSKASRIPPGKDDPSVHTAAATDTLIVVTGAARNPAGDIVPAIWTAAR